MKLSTIWWIVLKNMVFFKNYFLPGHLENNHPSHIKAIFQVGSYTCNDKMDLFCCHNNYCKIPRKTTEIWQKIAK